MHGGIPVSMDTLKKGGNIGYAQCFGERRTWGVSEVRTGDFLAVNGSVGHTRWRAHSWTTQKSWDPGLPHRQAAS